MTFPVNFNGQILPEAPAALDQCSRGFFYADSLFETMRLAGGRLPFLKNHLRRLFAGMDAFGYERPPHWQADFFENEILKIAPADARVRLTVFRAPGGKFLPTDSTPYYYVQSEPMPTKGEGASGEFANSTFADLYAPLATGGGNVIKIGVSQKVVLPCDAFSNFKTLNAARYVAAALEARENGWHDTLLPNQHGRVCEATSSNVFMFRGNRLVTPSLSEGCVAGTMREFILEQAPLLGIAVEEKPITFAALEKADEIFLTNAIRGIVSVGEFRGRFFSTNRTEQLFAIKI